MGDNQMVEASLFGGRYTFAPQIESFPLPQHGG